MYFLSYSVPLVNAFTVPGNLDTWTDFIYMAFYGLWPLWAYARLSNRRVPWFYYIIAGFLGLFELAIVNAVIVSCLMILLLYFVLLRRSQSFTRVATGYMFAYATSHFIVSLFNQCFLLFINYPFNLNERLGNANFVNVKCISITILISITLYYVMKPLAKFAQRFLNSAVLMWPVFTWVTNIYIWGGIFLRFSYTYRVLPLGAWAYLWTFIAYYLIYYFVLKFMTDFAETKMAADSREIEINNLKVYTSHIEALYDDLRRFRHDYKNILYSLTGAVHNKDLDQAEDILNHVIKPTESDVEKKTSVLGRLSNIQDLDVKSLVYSKVMTALDDDLQIEVEVEKPFRFNNTVQPLDRIRIIAILMDNAINAAKLSKDKKVDISLFNKDKLQYIVVGNSTKESQVSLSAIEHGSNDPNFGANHGIGLKNLRMILARYPSVQRELSSDHYWLEQSITIPE